MLQYCHVITGTDIRTLIFSAIWSNSLQCHNTLLDLFLAFLLPADESFRDANCLPSKNQKNERMGFIAYMLYVQLMKL
uniref:Uncharacterized protein n=1 Tax=Aegilops tauschii subsp. strangulata TaxID=200361 RepID=A0A453BAZ3_AEGTS